MTAIILAGGKSTRLGFDKAFIKIKSASLIERQLKLLKSLFPEIIIVTNNPGKYRLRRVKVIQDAIAHGGPLSGIYSGLLASASFYNFVIACDMPLINSGLIKYMSQKTFGYDAVVPKINNRYEPLFCIYSKNCLKYIKLLLDKKIYKISNLFSKVKIKEIKKSEVLPFGSPEEIFMNINTPQDLKKLNG